MADSSTFAGCRPTPTSVTVSARRVIQPRPYESVEIMVSVTATPDSTASTGTNIDRIAALVSGRVIRYIEPWESS